ncbi:MAG: electron transfer flavoprotein subunit beta [Bdellovibrionaceae bacterium]|nr:electron transfer flavoprotein subunit beta [Pseudobdellovibrionaceae bacterium]|tara:strand:- start:2371 stop:3144 length:774 start_codon:yes stop_codon:yes gene_type:complete
MKTFVCIKQVPDTETKIQIKGDKSGIEEGSIKWVMNPYDEFAVEEALKLKTTTSDTVVVLSAGPKSRVVDSLRTALAMGADEAVVIDAPETIDCYLAAKLLAETIKKEGDVRMVFTGKLAIDGNGSSVGQMVAEFLEVPHAGVVSKLDFTEGQVVVERDVEGGAKEVFQLKTPCVISANKGLNTPRYASLPGIMKAKKKPLKELTAADLGLNDLMPKMKFKNFELPPEKPPVKMIEGSPQEQAHKLVDLLMNEAKVL